MKPEKKRERYEEFYKTSWAKAYGFWHKVITRGEHQVRLLEEILSKIDKETISILDVGCGQGDEVKEALSRLSPKKFQITANDTSREALDMYARNNPTEELIQERLENLPKRLKSKYDLILFSHCLYSVNLDGLFHMYMNMLQDNGSILIFLDSKESGLKKIQRKFWKRVHGVAFDENTAENVVNELSEQKIPYETIPFSNYMDLDRLQEIEKDGIAKLLLPFAFRTHNLEKAVVEDAVAYVMTLEKERKIENNTYAIVVRKR